MMNLMVNGNLKIKSIFFKVIIIIIQILFHKWKHSYIHQCYIVKFDWANIMWTELIHVEKHNYEDYYKKNIIWLYVYHKIK